MSTEVLSLETALELISPAQRERIALTTFFFYTKYLIHERNTSWEDAEDPQAALQELLKSIPKDELELEAPDVAVSALYDTTVSNAWHPRHTEREEILAYFRNLDYTFSEQELVEQIHENSYYKGTENPLDFAVDLTFSMSNMTRPSKNMFGQMDWEDGHKIIKAVGAKVFGGDMEAGIRAILSSNGTLI